MPLDQQDSSILTYKANIKYYQKRIADLDSGFINPVVAAQTAVNPDTYIQNLNDLATKANNLATRIETVSASLRIPVNATTEPNVAIAVAALDPTSNGAYISYETYITAMQQMMAGANSLNVEQLISNSSNDATSNSQLVQASIYAGYAAYAGVTIAAGTTNTSTISDWSSTDGNIQTVLTFADNYLISFPDPLFAPWAFASDVATESNQISNLTNLWNSFSTTGSQSLTTLGGALQNQTPLAPNPNITALTDTYLSNVNTALNNIDNLFNTSSWTQNDLCCFLNFTVGLQLQDLLGLIVILQMLKFNVNFDFKDLLNSFENVLTNIMRNLILNEILNILLQMSQRIVQPLENWINTETNSLAQMASICPAVEKFVQTYIIGSIQMAETQLNTIIVEFMKQIELKKIQSDSKISLATTSNWINQALQMISMVQQAMQLASKSANISINVSSGVASQVIGELPGSSTYTYPVSSNPNTYNSFPVAGQANTTANVGGCTPGVLPKGMPSSPQWSLQAGTAPSNTAPTTST